MLGDVPTVTVLLSLGADPDARDAEYGSTPLGWAEHGGHDEVVSLLRPLTRSADAAGGASESVSPSTS